MSEKGAIKKSTAQAICDAVKAKEGTTEGVPFKDVAERILALPTASGENKLVQIIEGTITELTPEDLEGVTIIGNAAFDARPTLKNVTLPDNITSIGSSAFASSGLERINIPSSVVSIGNNAFGNCSNIQRVDITDLKSWLNISFAGNYGYTETSNPTAVAKGKLYLNGELVTSLVLTEDTPVNSTGFACNLDLKSLSIIGEMSIFSYAFYKSGLETANLAKVTTIDYYAFHNCSNLTEVLIGDTVTSIGGYALNVGSANNKATIRFLGTIPPSIQSSTIGNNVEKIIVPVGCGDIYKSATNFSAKADIIEEDAE